MSDAVKRQQRLSLQERYKRNPVAWIVLLVLGALLWGTLTLPTFFEWQEKKVQVKNLTQQINQLQKASIKKKQEAEAKEIEFNNVAGPYLSEEKQIFPSKINVEKVTKILELYALQLENLDSRSRDSHFDLNKISFGASRREIGKMYASTDLTLSFSSDRENLETFVDFLQTGALSERFQAGKEQGQISLVDYKFLEDNLLPLVHVESINASAKENNSSEWFTVQMRAKLFSQQ